MKFTELVRTRLRVLAGPAPMNDFPDYDAYWDERGNLDVIHHRWEVARDLIPDGASVLDVGCGSGEFLTYLREHRPNCKLHGVDGSTRSVEMLRSAGIDAELLDVETTDIDGQFDYVTCMEVLEHIPHAEVALERLMAAAKEQAIISIPNVGYWACRARLAVFGRFPVTNCIFHIREHVRHWTPVDFREWTSRLGYRVVAEHPQTGFPKLWRRFPSLFANGMVYAIERPGPAAAAA